jgi:CGNR zinc finger/Putative stress-induced transcription regulator
MEPVDAIEYMLDSEPAPGRLALVQRFANTVDAEHGREVLHGPEPLRALLVELGLLEPAARVSRRDLARALDVREAIRSLALANNGVDVRGDAAAALEAQLVVRFDPRGGALVPARRNLEGALADLAGIVYTAMADGTWPRLKACRREVCQWLFYDRSRNRSAVWCQMAVCGNRTKTKAYRLKRAATLPPTPRSGLSPSRPPT